MVKFRVQTRTGTVHNIEVQQDFTLMEALRHAGFDEVLAICGGQASCGTCHVHLEAVPGFMCKPSSPDEEGLLEGLEDVESNSRLSCQIMVSSDLEGAVVKIV
jgi:2Fe-2S ferredoxin